MTLGQPFGTVTDPPLALALLAALATRLGDGITLIAVVALFYWLAPSLTANPRSVGASLVGFAVAAMAVTVGAKALVAAPRPPGAGTIAVSGPFAEFVRASVDAEGYAFPSGHALGATVVYGGFAALLDVGRRRVRLAVAGGAITVIAATRVVLGLHYVIDVIGGVVIGLATLAALLWAGRRGFRPRPDRVLFAAGSAGVGTVLIGAALAHEPTLVGGGLSAGAGFGGYAVWRLRGTDRTPVGIGWGAVGLVVVGTAFFAVTSVAASGVPEIGGVFADTAVLRLVVVTALSAVGVATLVGWPTVVRRLSPARGG